MRAETVRIGPAKPGDPVLGLLIAPFGMVLLWWAGKAASMDHPNDRAWAIWFAVAGIALIAGVLWLAARGVTGRQALRLEDGALVVERLRPRGAEIVVPWAQIVALHHGGLGDRHPLVRVEYSLHAPPVLPGHVATSRRQTRMLALPRHGFDMPDDAVLHTLRQRLEAGGASLRAVSGVPVFGRQSWIVDHSADSTT